jgi:hypothetical protein
VPDAVPEKPDQQKFKEKYMADDNRNHILYLIGSCTVMATCVSLPILAFALSFLCPVFGSFCLASSASPVIGLWVSAATGTAAIQRTDEDEGYGGDEKAVTGGSG